MKKLFALMAALALCLSLTACGGDQNEDPNDVVGDDWRVTGVVRAEGTITRDGGDVYVLVCVNDDDAVFCYDDETYAVYDYVDYPMTLQGDPWEEFQSIDFADRNGDGNSDVAMLFELDGQTVLMVWFWDADTESYVFQPEESLIDGYSDAEPVPEGFDGVWYLEGEEDAAVVISIGVADDWILYDQADGELKEIDSGTLRVLDEAQGHYAADSEVYEGVSYNLVTADDNAFYWGTEGDYHLYERLKRW